jgi:hypothetical protein
MAKKEKERREALRKEGKIAKVFTNQDIANLKSTLAFEVTRGPEPEGEEADTEGSDSTLPPVTAQVDEQAQADEEEERLRAEREALEQQARDAQETINRGGGYHTRNIGSQYKAKREAESRIREIDDELENEEGSEEQQ